MPHPSDPAGSRVSSCAVVLDIIDGRPWKVRAVRNNNLRQHCHLLARTFRCDPITNSELRRPMRHLLRAVMENSNLLESTHPSNFQLIPILTRLCAYAGKWMRDPLAWNGGDGTPASRIHSLAAHLFERYPVSPVFRNAWFVKGDTRYLERDWYCHIASGRSLRSVPGFPPSITARALHLALHAPGNLTIRQALRWGQLKAVSAPMIWSRRFWKAEW